MSSKVHCAFCNVEREPSETWRIRHCSTCEVWCCKDCSPNSGFTKCPKCEKYELS